MKTPRLPFVLRLILIALLVGLLVGLAELYIGHRFILDPVLHEVGSEFENETFLGPTFYGLTKSIVVAITFFFVFLCSCKSDLKPITKSSLVGVVAMIIFGIYYYITFPATVFISTAMAAVVHFTFAAGITFLIVKVLSFE